MLKNEINLITSIDIMKGLFNCSHFTELTILGISSLAQQPNRFLILATLMTQSLTINIFLSAPADAGCSFLLKL